MSVRNPGLTQRVLAGLAVMAGMLGALSQGCSSEDYYCDANGCYQCDGVGCRPVSPPSRTPCRGDRDCAAGTVCTSLGCTPGCHADSDCPHGDVCHITAGASSGLCAAPTENPTPNPGTCHSNTDCGDGVCVDGVCQNNPACGTTMSCGCHADSDCHTAGTVCVAGVCTAQSNTCQFNSQCGAGRICVNSQCRTGCAASSDCPHGETCTDGACVDAPTGECTTDAMCGAGHVCVNSTCVLSCATSADCAAAGTGLYCTDGHYCAPDTRPHPFCTSDAMCAAGHTCVSGVCRTPCNTSDDCAAVDVAFRNCGTDHFCHTDHEVHPVCARQTDCAMGQSCVDAVCQ